MKKNCVFITLFFLLYIGCKEKPSILNDNLSITDLHKDSAIAFMMKKFSLPYSEDFMADSNSLIFYATRAFDTSFLIHLKYASGGINGVYYEIIPDYHNDINDFAISNHQLLYFEGYSFVIDSAKWGIIKNEATKLLSSKSNFNTKQACRDCKEYILCYNLKSDIDNGIRYNSFYNLLKKLFLENFIQKRVPKMHKEK